ncbi:type VII secretion integral membrane protein EccD [Micromonospora echinofusca]|uniref:Type VII secretion integral membrane protein EccD n=1 Tax=Micromonospora echinofusca TaxID=47858 RepID=A0ABS3VZA7_MICEH|nr:type VII secretion integral membrane protein EccD [Micromonospora echinofusca]MBO4209862.1 type VII secretion integral membrane protein EccD [Micromonospora echinofusca]
MTAPGGLSLARVTVAAPKRRMDVALPDNLLVAELLPHLLRHAGDDLGEAAERSGGWVLRRATGTVLEPTRNLAVQGVRDGELLHLAPGGTDWPELAYDDVVEVIAGGARRVGRSWGNAATRRCGLAVGAVLLTLGVAVPLLAGPPWTVPALVALGFAALLAVAGLLLARAFADAVAGAVVAAAGLPYALAGGALLAVPDGAGLSRLGAPGVLLGSAALLVFSLAGYVGVAGVQRIFMAGITTGLAGLLAAGLCFAGASGAGAAAVTLTTVIALLPGYPVLASWLGRVPVPELPDRPEEILADRPMPKRSAVFSAVARATELLTGLLLAVAVTGVCALTYLLTVTDTTAATLLVVCASAALLLRARLFAVGQQRIPLLVGGIVGFVVLTAGLVLGAGPGGRLVALAPLALVGAGVSAAGLVYSRRRPSPYLGRAADILDVLAIMALIPLACAVLGVFGAIQGLFASIGG